MKKSIAILAILISALTCFQVWVEAGEDGRMRDGMLLLKSRRDKEALVIFEEIIASQPQNIDALWGRAEILRRERHYKEAEEILARVLKSNPGHAPSLISMAYIRYKDDDLGQALKLAREALAVGNIDRENKALAYMMLGTINSGRSSKSWVLGKIRYGTQIKGYFLKARELAPDLPEVRLGLGTFYLMAPAIVGGNLDEAFSELEAAVKLAPGFATANARLAQAYKKKGDLEKYNFYIVKVKEIDPENEVLKGIE